MFYTILCFGFSFNRSKQKPSGWRWFLSLAMVGCVFPRPWLESISPASKLPGSHVELLFLQWVKGATCWHHLSLNLHCQNTTISTHNNHHVVRYEAERGRSCIQQSWKGVSSLNSSGKNNLDCVKFVIFQTTATVNLGSLICALSLIWSD